MSYVVAQDPRGVRHRVWFMNDYDYVQDDPPRGRAYTPRCCTTAGVLLVVVPDDVDETCLACLADLEPQGAEPRRHVVEAKEEP